MNKPKPFKKLAISCSEWEARRGELVAVRRTEREQLCHPYLETRGINMRKKDPIKALLPKTISVAEHCALINRYRQFKSMGTVARLQHRSTATVHDHITAHNDEVLNGEEGACSRCMKAGDWWIALDLLEVNVKIVKNEEEEPNDAP